MDEKKTGKIKKVESVGERIRPKKVISEELKLAKSTGLINHQLDWKKERRSVNVNEISNPEVGSCQSKLADWIKAEDGINISEPLVSGI